MFESTDPLDREIKFKDSTWKWKIEEGHPELIESFGEEKLEEIINRLIENPRFILRDKTEAEEPSGTIRDLYRDSVENKKFEEIQVLRTIVEFPTAKTKNESVQGEVVTTFISSRSGDSTGKGVVYDRKAET